MNVILTESQMKALINEEIGSKEDLKKLIDNNPDFDKQVKKILGDAIKHDRDFEKRVKNIAADCIKTMYRILFQRSNFYDNDLRN